MADTARERSEKGGRTMRSKAFSSGVVALLVAGVLCLSLNAGWAGSGSGELENLAVRAPILLPIEQRGVVDCPGDLNEALPSRTVMQYIMNTFYKWQEYDLGAVNGKRRFCVVMQAPVRLRLSAGEAQALLSASRLGLESKPAPQAAVRPKAPGSRSKIRPVDRFLPWIKGGFSLDHVFGSDDRIRITTTTGFPWNTMCYTDSFYDFAEGRGSGCLVSPYMVLTAGHNVYLSLLGGYTNSIWITPGQTQLTENDPLILPFGEQDAFSWETNAEYIANENNEADYAAIFLEQPFSSITTFMPLVFNHTPSDISIAGYPMEVQGETESEALWLSQGRVSAVETRFLKFTLDVTQGNSGGPIWVTDTAGQRIVGVAARQDANTPPAWNGGPRLCTANQAIIEQWMQWRPPSPPPAPTNVQASDGSYTDRVLISWTDSAGATGYVVFLNTVNQSATAAQIGTVSASPFSDLSANPGTVYYYWVKAQNTVGDSPFSIGDSGYRAYEIPLWPTNLQASDGTYTDRVALTWTGSAGATGYKIFRNTVGNGATAVWIGTPAASPYADYTATPGRPYYYWVKATNPAGDSIYSNVDTGYRAFARPASPRNLAASDGTYTDRVALTWTGSAGATSYKVYRNTVGNGATAVQIGTASALSYADYTAAPGRPYYYWVKATGPGGDSSFSNVDTGYRAVRPASPRNLSATTYADRVVLSWTGSAGATSYKIYRNTSCNALTAVQIGAAPASPYSDYTATPGRPYYYWVKASNAAGDSPFSNPVIGYRAVRPTSPRNLSATDGTYTDRVVLSWTGSAGATSYKVYRNTSCNGATAVQIGTASTPTYSDSSGAQGMPYYYWVKASNVAGDSAFSNVDTGYRAFPRPPAPTGVSASDGTYSDHVVISWTPSAGAVGYKIFRHAHDTSATATQISIAVAPPFSDYSAGAGTLYYYWVKAYSAGGDSGFSLADCGWHGSVGSPTPLTVDGPILVGNIAPSFDSDWYSFAVAAAGFYDLNSFPGSLGDNEMNLYGPNDATRWIVRAYGPGSRILISLSPGTYYIQMSARVWGGAGTYAVRVRRIGGYVPALAHGWTMVDDSFPFALPPPALPLLQPPGPN